MLNGTKVVMFQHSVSAACFDLVWSRAVQLSNGNLELARTRRCQIWTTTQPVSRE
jgi:hypothetical protein